VKNYQATMKEIIHIKCLDCMGGDASLVLECDSPDCPLISVRPTSRPDALKKKYWHETGGFLKAIPTLRRRVVSEEVKQQATERLRELQKKRRNK
jgi:hypothetical protein